MAETITTENPVAETQQPVANVAKKQGRVLQPKAETPPALQPLGPDDRATRSTTFVKPKVVRDTFTFRFVDKGPRFQREVEFDFSDCSDEEIVTMALQSARIDLQSKLRALGEKNVNATTFAKCNVKLDLLEKSREAVDPKIAAVRRLMVALPCSFDEALAIVEKEMAKRAK
jgi:hypothetical protein